MKKDKYKNTRVVIRQKDKKHDFYLFENTTKEFKRAIAWFKKGDGGLMGTLEEMLQYAAGYVIRYRKELTVQ